jgi:hypothetical protein
MPETIFSNVVEFGLSIGRPKALLHTKAAIVPNALDTPKSTV